MRYFAACIDDTGIEASTLFAPRRVLLSYHYYKNKGDRVRELLEDGVEVFIDSGAFSAKNSGTEVNLDEYCEYLHQVKPTRYAVLDVIGDAKGTLENQRYMESKGLKPIPTFHMGSRITELDPYLEYDYIALGGMVMSSGIQNHCDKVWAKILKTKPDLKVHGFGLTNLNLMKRYPWYSVDSSSFQSLRRFGRTTILTNGLQFDTISEDEFLNLLKKGYRYGEEGVERLMEDKTRNRNYIYDLHAVNSIKLYAEHLRELNKHRDFSYLTQQLNLFEL